MISLSNVISVNVNQTPVGLGAFNINNIALFTTDTPLMGLATYGNYGVYVSSEAVAGDFGTDSETYQQSVALFAQAPNILQGNGNLIIAPLQAGAVNTASVSGTTGGLGYAIGDLLTLVAPNASGCILKVLTLAAGTAGRVETVEVISAGIGYTAVSNLATTYISGTGTGLKITVGSVAVETMVQALYRVSQLIFFCGILSTSYPTGSDRLTLANSVQSYGDKMLFLPSNSITDIAGEFTTIQSATDYCTRCLYYGGTALESRLFAAAYAGRGMSVDFSGSNQAITMNLKQLETIVPDATVNQTVVNLCQVAGVDVYANIAGVSGCLSNGNNYYFDRVYNLIWFVSALKVAGFNALEQLTTKVPQTEPGMLFLKSVYKQICEQGVSNGYIAAGRWTSADTFGVQIDFLNNILVKGYYIYSQPVNLQNVADRAARKAPTVQIAIKESGAIHSSIVNIYINP